MKGMLEIRNAVLAADLVFVQAAADRSSRAAIAVTRIKNVDLFLRSTRLPSKEGVAALRIQDEAFETLISLGLMQSGDI